MPLTILHTNDFHGTFTPEKARCIAELKGDGVYFDTGDCIKTGNLGIPLRPELAWRLLFEAGCDASVLGNRETHVLTNAFKAKIEGHRHPLLCANLRAKNGPDPLPASLMLERADLKIGVFGVMVPMVTERMKTQAASAFLWEPPIETAARVVADLRSKCDLLIALTHIGHRQDLKLAETVPGIDIILGGHSHTLLEAPDRAGTTWICQGGSHGRYVGKYLWDQGHLSGALLPL